MTYQVKKVEPSKRLLKSWAKEEKQTSAKYRHYGLDTQARDEAKHSRAFKDMAMRK